MFLPLKNPHRIKRLAALLATAAAVFVWLFAEAGSSSRVKAHAKLLRSQPADGEVLRQPPKRIELEFSAKLQNVSLNSIIVTAAGRRVDKNVVSLSADGKHLICELEEIEAAGDYTVEWRALSADDHPMTGKFAFSFSAPDRPESASAGGAETPLETQTENQVPPSTPHQHHERQESAVNRAQIAVRWLTYLSLMTIFGGFAFRLLVMQPAAAAAVLRGETEREDGSGGLWEFREGGGKRFTRLTQLSLASLAVMLPASLILQTYAVLNASSGVAAIEPESLLRVLSETGYGAPWLMQAALFVVLLGVSFFIIRNAGTRQRQDEKSVFGGVLNKRKTFLLWSGLALCALMFLAMSLTGHARAAAADECPLAIFSNWLHLLAVGIWTGGLFHLVLTLPKMLARLEGSLRLSVLYRVISLFSRLAIAAAIFITLTGIYNSLMHLDDLSDLWNTGYGVVLGVKIILFLPMLALGGFNTFVLRPSFGAQGARETGRGAPGSGRAEVDTRRFYRSVRVEATIGLIVLLLAALLSFLPTPRRHETRGDAPPPSSAVGQYLNPPEKPTAVRRKAEAFQPS